MDGHAVVIGASMAGLSAARVLADRYERVTVLDRDTLPAGPEPRRGVPQGNHGHILLISGLQTLDGLFPGLREELLATGATAFDTGADMVTYRFGHRWPPFRTDLELVSASRPHLEAAVRARVTASILDGVAVSGLAGDGNRVTGVTLDSGETLDADLVVDCSGRGARSDRWLSGLGFPVPGQLEIKVGVAYSTRYYRRAPGQLYGKSGALVLPDPRHERLAGLILPVEGDRWLVAIGGWHVGELPTDPEGFERVARSLPDPVLGDLMTEAEPLTEPIGFRYPSSRRRQFEELDRHPAGYITLGDALCSFNPIYGQGMTCAALEAVALGETLDKHRAATAAMAADYYAAAARVISIPWQFGAGGDFAYAETTGARPPRVAFTNWFGRTIGVASQVDPSLHRQFSAVQQLVASPDELRKPRFLARVLWSSLRQPFTRPG